MSVLAEERPLRSKHWLLVALIVIVGLFAFGLGLHEAGALDGFYVWLQSLVQPVVAVYDKWRW